MFKEIFKFLASLKFAITLLAVLIIAIIFGTIFDSQMSADVAQKYIYNAWWFNAWLAALCVNLFCVAAIRYPWKRHQTGFVITHAGIITLLIGSMIDRKYGIEGSLQLHSNQPATDVMELLTQELRVRVDGSDAAVTPFKLTTLSQMSANSPSKDVKIEIADVEPVTEVLSAVQASKDDAEARPGLNFTLQGAMMGRHDKCIFLNQRDSQSLAGMAEIIFVPGMPPDPNQKPDGRAVLVFRFKGKSFRFDVKQNEEKDIPLEGLPDWKLHIIGYYPNFTMDRVPRSIDENPVNPVVAFDVIGPEVKGVVVSEVAAHGGVPKQDPNKVAPSNESFFVFYKSDEVINVPRHGGPTGADAQLVVNAPRNQLTGPNGLAIYLGGDQKLRYLIRSRNKSHTDDTTPAFTEKTGDVVLETPVPVGWAPGAQFVVHDFIERAVYKSEIVPRPEMKSEMDHSMQGLDCRVTAGGETKQLWVYWQPWDSATPQSLSVAGKKVDFEFINQTVKLPFTVGLKKFRAPQDEGSNEVSAFESTLSFGGRKDTVWLKSGGELAKAIGMNVLTGAVIEENENAVYFVTDSGEEDWINRKDIDRYEIQTQKISMNRPTTFPLTWYGPFTGWNYKFSQANHHLDFENPEKSDYTYSGVQVLRDPGWMPKWIGCIMICFGIFTMFYLRPYFNRPKVAVKAAEKIETEMAIEKIKGNKKRLRKMADAAAREQTS
ncbi:MAG TPA: hypothetical protein VKX17_11755 [Planctomycetota bacterium]|nr:hypothetical protein [Planctomycetota bacterium]